MKKLLARLADRLVLCSSTNFIDPEDRIRREFPFDDGHLEIFECYRNEVEGAPGLVVLKFPGTGGRAERAGPHPAELVNGYSKVVWTFNPAGYGGSSGRASLQTLSRQCDALMEHVTSCFPGWNILLTGNSLGCISALYLAARHPVVGVYLRNPPPLAAMISERQRYNWWNFGTARFVGDMVPGELDSVANARQCKVPCLFLQSGQDTVVPVEFQDRIIEAWQGEKFKFVIPGAEHHERVPEELADEYLNLMQEFFKTFLKGAK